VRISTLTQSEKFDRESEARATKRMPKQKPPRRDRRKNKLRNTDPDLTMEADKKDLKRSSVERLVLRVAHDYYNTHMSYVDVDDIVTRVAAESDPVRLATKVHAAVRNKTASAMRIHRDPASNRFVHVPAKPERVARGDEPMKVQRNVITNEDASTIVSFAKENVNSRLLETDPRLAFDDALDTALSTFDEGRYQGKVDAPTYLALLNLLSNSQ